MTWQRKGLFKKHRKVRGNMRQCKTSVPSCHPRVDLSAAISISHNIIMPETAYNRG